MKFLLALLPLPLLGGETIHVSNNEELEQALSRLKPHTILRINDGEYRGGWSVRGIDHLTVTIGKSKSMGPRFVGGKTAWHFSKCNNLKITGFYCDGQSINGINIDDGGDYANPTKNVTVSGMTISNIGPRGNTDALKCSGIDKLTITKCRFEGWGGQAIDLVGCHKSSITDCRFEGKEGFTQASGTQFKGGCEDITLENCSFKNAGTRPINVGGSTGLAYFRPPGAKFEARRITIRNNTIRGSLCAVAFTGVDGAEFTRNLVIYPEKWILRILQETSEPGFPPCRKVDFHHNVIVYKKSQVRVPANVGANTAPGTFTFHNNLWFASDSPKESKPVLPTRETDGLYLIDPGLENGEVTSPVALEILGK
ncbi:right-handed parallel beta-helix repeat-containing protein [Akkermansiaceae bacterium]|nr:right-handed parallel beta-helix repeat-containing protein [Akkermansiaceae bacterium]MDA7887787.1 right-handed parallel beta-helix repeat-containing protein [Akkermansiaceae bacterium]MDB4536981.1 right-handed parallel beta-helix repeat-containing protein [Akkermansiaceae bacterium]